MLSHLITSHLCGFALIGNASLHSPKHPPHHQNLLSFTYATSSSPPYGLLLKIQWRKTNNCNQSECIILLLTTIWAAGKSIIWTPLEGRLLDCWTLSDLLYVVKLLLQLQLLGNGESDHVSGTKYECFAKYVQQLWFTHCYFWGGDTLDKKSAQCEAFWPTLCEIWTGFTLSNFKHSFPKNCVSEIPFPGCIQCATLLWEWYVARSSAKRGLYEMGRPPLGQVSNVTAWPLPTPRVKPTSELPSLTHN